MTFDQIGLAEPILRAVTAEGYSTPTPIQAAAIPAAMTGRDLLGVLKRARERQLRSRCRSCTGLLTTEPPAPLVGETGVRSGGFAA